MGGVRSGASQSDLAAAAEPAELGSVVTLRRRRSGADANLHDAVPVVARGDLKQGEEGHAEVLEGGVTTHTLAWVVCVANWGPERRKADRGEEKKRGGDEKRRGETESAAMEAYQVLRRAPLLRRRR